MNGSKNILLVIIFIFALLPWGLFFVLLSSEDGARLLGIPSAESSPEEIQAMQETIERQTREIDDLNTSLSLAQDGAEPLITPAELRELRETSDQLRRDNIEAGEQIERLRTEYNSALSEVVKLKTQQMAAEAAPPRPAPEPTPEPEPAPAPAPAPAANPGGWILPPSN